MGKFDIPQIDIENLNYQVDDINRQDRQTFCFVYVQFIFNVSRHIYLIKIQ